MHSAKNMREEIRHSAADFAKIGWDVPDSEGTMFVWAPVPKGHGTSEEFCMELMEKTGLIGVPGSSFGSLGEDLCDLPW